MKIFIKALASYHIQKSLVIKLSFVKTQIIRHCARTRKNNSPPNILKTDFETVLQRYIYCNDYNITIDKSKWGVTLIACFNHLNKSIQSKYKSRCLFLAVENLICFFIFRIRWWTRWCSKKHEPDMVHVVP